MKRRKALKNIGLSLGAITMSATVASLLQGCKGKPLVKWTPQFFTADEAEIVLKTLEVILPATPDVPGATDLHLAKFIDGYLHVVPPEKERAAFKAGVEQYLSTTLTAANKKSPIDLSNEDVEKRLAYYLKANPQQQKSWNAEVAAAMKKDGAMPSEDAVNFSLLKSLRDRGIFAFKNSQQIGEEVLAYAPIPKEQKGCVNLQEATGGKAWSL